MVNQGTSKAVYARQCTTWCQGGFWGVTRVCKRDWHGSKADKKQGVS